jgi:hypothetical protein
MRSYFLLFIFFPLSGIIPLTGIKVDGMEKKKSSKSDDFLHM